MNLVEDDDEDMFSSEEESSEFDTTSEHEHEPIYAELTPLEPLAEFQSDQICKQSGGHFESGYMDSSSLEYIPPLSPVPTDSNDSRCASHNSSVLMLLESESKGFFSFFLDDSKRSFDSDSIHVSKNGDSQPTFLTELGSPCTPDRVIDWSDVELDTRNVAERVTSELRRLNISQVLFAQKILGRSQGTLSDLLRNPKPWAKMKSGRETFGRMLKWLQESDAERLAILSSSKTKPFQASLTSSPSFIKK